MTTPQPLPRTLAAWTAALDAVRLPVVTRHHDQVRRALGDSRRSMRDIAEVIQASPVLALYVLREANRSRNALAEKAESLEVALARLGLTRTAELLERIPTVDEAALPRGLRQLLVISQHASQQANGLFAARLARLWQDIHWGSLLFLAPVWTLVTLRPDLFEHWEGRALAAGEPAARLERELLGVPLFELCLALAERWRLPDWIADGYRLLVANRRLFIKALHIARDNEHPLHQQQMLDEDPPLRRWLTLPSNTIVLANGLALSSHHSWSGVHSLRWQRLTGLYMQLPLGDLQQLVHQQAAQSARHSAAAELWHPAQGLAMPWESVFQPRPASRPSAPPPPSASPWRACCTELLREPSPFGNTLQLLGTARQAFVACGLSRVLLLQVDRQQRLVAQQAHGLPSEANTLVLDPAQSQLIRRLLDKPALLRLKPDNVAQFSAHLPGGLKALFPSEQLLLRSVGCNGRVILLVIADQNGLPLADTATQAFDKTVQCLERALATFYRRPT